MSTFFFVLHSEGWEFGQPLPSGDPLYLQATAACLTAIVAMQIVNVFLCRSPRRSLWSTGLLGNPLIIWGVALEIVLILLIDYTAWGNAILGTAPVPKEGWLFLISFAAGILLLEELRKWLARSWGLKGAKSELS